MNPAAAESSKLNVSGRISERPMEQLLLYAREKRLSGSLSVTIHGEPIVSIVFSAGSVWKIRTSASCFLGSVLHQNGLIDDRALNETLFVVAEKKKLFGIALQELGHATQTIVEKGLRAQVETKVARMVSEVREGDWSFASGVDTLVGYGGDDWPKIDACIAVWHGVRGRPVDDVAIAMVRKLAARNITLTSDPRKVPGFDIERPERLDTLARGFVPDSALDGRDPEMTKLVYFLTIARMLAAETDAKRPPSRGSVSISQTLPSPAIAPSFRAPAITVPPAQPGISLTPGPGTTRAPATGVVRGSGTVPRSNVEAATASTGPSRLDREAVLTLFGRLNTLDHYGVLGVEKHVSVEAIRAAFFRLQREWSPERSPPELDDVRDRLQRVFARMLLAYRTLLDPARRALYDRTSAAPSIAPPTGREEKATVISRVNTLIGRGELLKAAETCRTATDHDPEDGELLALLAHVKSLEASFVDDIRATRRVLEMFDNALVLAPVAAPVYFYRGLANKRRGSVNAALRDFKMAVELDPNHTDAVRELRLFHMRRDYGAQGGEAMKPQPGRRDSVGRLFAALKKPR